MILIRGGKFIFGTDPLEEEKLPAALGMTGNGYQNETPRQTIYLDDFYIDKYEVTIGAYRDFMKATGHALPKAWVELDLEKWKDYPAQGITWREADDYVKWQGKRLPTEAQWEKASRGPNGLRYVFGDKFDPQKARTDLKETIPVARTDFDRSYYGVSGLSGNLSEWCADWYGPHPGSDYHDSRYGKKNKVYKGGSWVNRGHYNFSFFYRCARRGFGRPDKAYGDVGFRGVYVPQ